MLMSRQVSSDWGAEEASTLTIERIDQPVRRYRQTPEDLEQRLQDALQLEFRQAA